MYSHVLRLWRRRGAEAASLLFDSGKERESLVEMLSEDREEAYLRATFESYVASVEVGLEGFNGADGPKKLLRALDARFAGALVYRVVASRAARPPHVVTRLAGAEHAGGRAPAPPRRFLVSLRTAILRACIYTLAGRSDI